MTTRAAHAEMECDREFCRTTLDLWREQDQLLQDIAEALGVEQPDQIIPAIKEAGADLSMPSQPAHAETVIKDLIEVCYQDGASSSWRLCLGCNTENHREWDTWKHGPDCPVVVAERYIAAVRHEAGADRLHPHEDGADNDSGALRPSHHGVEMNLYLLSQSVNDDYDTYDSAVVCARSVEDARKVEVGSGGSWCAPEHVSVRYLGVADASVVAGVVLASFNAG